MKISFCLPSCNYNIILTREELQQLIDTGHTGVIRPDRISGLYYDERGRRQEGVYHDLRYLDRNGEESVQFLTVNVEKETSDNGQS